MTIDTVIFSGFLLANLVIGLFFSRGTKNIKEYAVGDRNFSTGTMSATVVATWIGAGYFSGTLTEAYRQGLFYILPAIGITFELIIIGYFLAPRMIEFFGTLSVAEAMGKIYGTPVRIITAISGILFAVGIVSLQFKVAASVMQVFFGISSFYITLSSAAVITLYSSFGGVKAITYTDIFQFLTFIVIIPLISNIIWGSNDSIEVINSIRHNPLFNFKQVLDINDPRFLTTLSLFLVFFIPTCDPAEVQRILMAKGVKQAKKSFIIAGILLFIVTLLTSWISILLFYKNPNLDPNNLLSHIIENYTYVGLKGLTAIGIMAIVMSTADSYIHSATVLLTHDIINQLNLKKFESINKLSILHIVAIIIGIIAFILAYKISGIFNILVLTLSFYMPIVSVPLLLAIFGFRSSTKVVLLGMFAGAMTVILWLNFGSPDTNEVIPGMLANLIVFMIGHFISGKPKGNMSSECDNNLKSLKQHRKAKYKNFFIEVKNFNFLAFCKNNLPKHQSSYFLFGFFALVSIYSTMYSFSNEIRLHHKLLIDVINHSSLIGASIFLIYPLYSEKYKNEKIISVLWIIAVPYVLIFVPILQVLISKFGNFQLMICMISLVILALFVKWQVALIMLGIGSYLAVTFYKAYSGYQDISLSSLEIGLQFKIIYVLLLISSILIAFFKPRQEEQERAEELNQDLSSKIIDQNDELYKLSELKDEFIRNLQHETNTPLMGITSIGQTLQEHYDEFSDDMRKQSIGMIAASSERLTSFAHNLVDLSKLKTLTYSLKIREINLSQLVSKTLEKCIKLYIPIEDKDDRDFIVNIEPDVIFKGDEYYIERAIKNIIVNAIQYCKKGKIEISLYKTQDNIIKFAVKDEGIGIPKEELSSIFGSFTTSSKTRTRAGGRGIGLTVANSVIKLHKGEIIAESDGNSGSIFVVSLP